MTQTDGAEYGQQLVVAIEEALPGWVQRCVREVLRRQGIAFTDEIARSTADAGRRAQEFVSERLRALLAKDIDQQSGTPLTIVREAAVFPTEVLRQAGAVPVERDDYVRAHFPADDYDITPTKLGDVDESLVEPGLAWGAWKAMAHKARHRSQ